MQFLVPIRQSMVCMLLNARRTTLPLLRALVDTYGVFILLPENILPELSLIYLLAWLLLI